LSSGNILTVRTIAFYLPQYHPIPENDLWWGKGFTEWTNVTRAKPLFRGHYQPHLPADLGFYDLRLPETRLSQAALAHNHGISGFCYYHYWFGGKRLLERPVNEMLASGQPDFPFCLCWANENWARTWDGLDKQILIQQSYSPDDDRNHIRWLANVFVDPRYIRVQGKPMFLVYRAANLPNPFATTQLWREEARRLGIGELHLCKVESLAHDRGDFRAQGFDAAVEFQPDTSNISTRWQRRLWYLKQKLQRYGVSHGAMILDYKTVAEKMSAQPLKPGRYPCITPMWDNSARRKSGAMILHNSKPEYYAGWLCKTIEKVNKADIEPLIFINAWNEWAEGNHLEPCQRWGRAYLEATKRALCISSS
jgi:lipopolysaccharide biosynthesis protein